ncbi:MAG TPA: HypC/HybG/HupF family hydrogenase formation chaperone, partial [Coriobacteriia bacterium]
PAAEVGSWVLVHAGYAIDVVDEQFAAETWDLLQQMADGLDAQDAALLDEQVAKSIEDAGVPADSAVSPEPASGT